MIPRILGGMMGARQAPPRMVPIDRRTSYFRSNIIGSSERPIIAPTAMADPDSDPRTVASATDNK